MLKRIILNTGCCLMAICGGLMTRRMMVTQKGNLEKEASSDTDPYLKEALNKGIHLSEQSRNIFRKVRQKAAGYHVAIADADMVGIRFFGSEGTYRQMFVSFGKKIEQKPSCRHFQVDSQTQEWKPIQPSVYQERLTNLVRDTEDTLLICRTKTGHMTVTTYQNKDCPNGLNLSVSYREENPCLLDLQFIQKQNQQPISVTQLFYDSSAGTGTVARVQLPRHSAAKPIFLSRKAFSFRYQKLEYTR